MNYCIALDPPSETQSNLTITDSLGEQKPFAIARVRYSAGIGRKATKTVLHTELLDGVVLYSEIRLYIYKVRLQVLLVRLSQMVCLIT